MMFDLFVTIRKFLIFFTDQKAVVGTARQITLPNQPQPMHPSAVKMCQFPNTCLACLFFPILADVRGVETATSAKAVKLLKMLPGMSTKEDASKVKSESSVLERLVRSHRTSAVERAGSTRCFWCRLPCYQIGAGFRLTWPMCEVGQVQS